MNNEKIKVIKNNIKVYSKRTLKTIKKFTLITLPFTIAFASFTGISLLANTGVPIYRDEIPYKTYIQGQMNSDGNCIEEKVYDNIGLDCYLKVIIYSPWVKTGNEYERKIYQYDLAGTMKNLNKYKDYITTNDYDELEKLLKNPSIRIEKVSEIPNNDENTYHINCLYVVWSKNKEKYTESQKNNIETTIFILTPSSIAELIAILGEMVDFNFDYSDCGEIQSISKKIKRKK